MPKIEHILRYTPKNQFVEDWRLYRVFVLGEDMISTLMSCREWHTEYKWELVCQQKEGLWIREIKMGI